VCGISGLVSLEHLGREDDARVGRMSRALFHRGPDAAGAHCAPHVTLAASRLAINDLDGGAQPLYNEDRTLALVANGEIYNHVALRRRLEDRGHQFATLSDCETILHAYEEYGLECVEHLRGMFAFALWDDSRRRLLLARDRMGEKPLYLYERPGRLLFASELKSLLASGEVPFELDAEAVNLYFHYQYVPEPRTPLRGVRKLDAARLLVVGVEPWRVEERCYWRMEDAPPIEGDAPSLIRERLEEVSALVVRADVGVGVALSGGVDSGAVAALAARERPGEVRAFSVGYEGRPRSDERYEARELARALGLPFHEVELRTEDVAGFFPELNYWRDEPIADISGHGYFAVMRSAREQGVAVMLQGQGGDELFWGYPLLRQAARESSQKEALGRQSPVAATLSYLSSAGRPALGRAAADLRTGWRLLREHRAQPPDRMVFYDLAPDFRAAITETPGLYTAEFAERLEGGGPAELFTFPRPWPRVDVALTRLVSATYLRVNGIAQGDRLGMASSVELRLPLVDHILVETVVGLRKRQTDVGLPPKTWLKQAVSDLLPPAVLDRPKRGFEPPVREWHEAIFAAHGATLRGGYLTQAGILKAEGAERLARGEFSADAVCPLSFKALVLEQWCRRMSGLGA
jgi:asparagine synthase (glutamine-hydrolysing)